jgi:hypothetical protein
MLMSPQEPPQEKEGEHTHLTSTPNLGKNKNYKMPPIGPQCRESHEARCSPHLLKNLPPLKLQNISHIPNSTCIEKGLLM